MENAEKQKISIKLKTVIIVNMLIIAILCVLMVANTIAIHSYNKHSVELSREHVTYTDIVLQLSIGSDVLTEQARLFAETGERRYMNGYFEEANVTKHREAAVEMLEKLPDIEANEKVLKAMDESVKLMRREYYSMRLTAAGYGISEESLPENVQNIILNPQEQILSQEEAKTKAKKLLYDDVYLEAKSRIKFYLNGYLDEVIEDSEREYDILAKKIDRHSDLQTAIVLMILLIIFIMTAFIYRFIISPVTAASKLIKRDLPINMPRFIREMNLLGISYNDLREKNEDLMTRLKMIAQKDVLTDIGNRFAYHNYISSVAAGKKKILMFVFDINNLHNTNNKEGHAAGDKLITDSADCIVEVFGNEKKDNCFRIGGDEFVAFIFDQPKKNAEEYIKRFEKKTEEKAISVAVGYSYAEEEDDLSMKRMFDEADEATYKKKYANRSRIKYNQEGVEY